MGKHNGKARPSGVKVGSALVNNARKVVHADTKGVHAVSPDRSCNVGAYDPPYAACQGGRGGRVGAIDEFRHTTDPQGAPNMQSVIENNDLTELLTMVGPAFVALRTVLAVHAFAPTICTSLQMVTAF